MRKFTVFVAVLVVLALGAWFVYEHATATPIAKVLSDPRRYEAQVTTITGVVSDRTSLIVLRYFVLKDDTGQIPVVTDRSLPNIGAKLRVRGKVQQAFAIGDSQLVVFVEEPTR